MKISDIFDVKGLGTVVTGAASGIGLAYSEVMSANGARVTLMDIDKAGLSIQVQRLKDAGGDVRGVAVDVTDRRAMREAFDETAGFYRGLDVVFANAGIDGGPGFLTAEGERNPQGAFENISDAQWDRVISTNLTSVFTTLQCAVRHMREARRGHIIVTTSNAALINEAIVGTPYMAAKAAAAHLVRQAALELAGYNICVNSIAPGAFVTNIADGRLNNAADRKAFEDRSPMHRLASTREIMGLALFMASSASSYMTGAQIVIDGGHRLGSVD